MQKLAEICIRRPVFASMLILALVVVGAAAYFKLGVDRLPSVDLPTVAVRTTLPGASPEEMETQVSRRSRRSSTPSRGSRSCGRSPGRGRLSSSRRSTSSRDIDVAAQDVRDRVATVLRRLPDDVDPPIVSKFDNDSAPVITLALSGERSMRELTELADKIVKGQLEAVGGRRRGAASSGGLERDDQRLGRRRPLAAYQLPITAVRDAIVRQNADVPGGNVTGPGPRAERSARSGRIADPKEFNDMVVAR